MEDEKEEQKKPKAPQMVKIEIVQQTGKNALVEYQEDETPKRVIVPVAKIANGKVELEELEAGIVYGVDWSKAKVVPITADMVDRELKARGIWTLDDLNANPMQVNSILFKLANATRRELIETAKRQK